MNNPKVSVIMTTHNGRRDLCKRAIESVLKQTFKDFELIIVDDASQDGTDEMVKSFDDARIKYIKRDKNFGTDTKPKNEGIMASDGWYIAFLDSDNTYRPDHLNVLVNALDKDDNVEAVYGDRMVFDGGNNNKMMGLGVSSDFIPFLLLRRNYIDTSDVLIRRDALYEVGGFDERYRKFIDWNLWVRMAKYGMKFKRIPIVITDYFVYPDSKSQRQEDTIPDDAYGKPAWNPFDCEIVLPFLNNEVKEPKVAVFSLTYDRLPLTKECFASMYSTAGYPLDHIVIDNGSTDDTPVWLENEWENPLGLTTFVLNGVNKGISIASNQAVKMIQESGDYDIIVKVDNDAFFETQGWLKKMVEIWKRSRMMALSCYITGLKDNPGGAPREEYGYILDELVGLTKHIGGICHFVDARAYDNFKWDEESNLHGVQDVEFSQHLIQHGYQMAYLEGYFCEHRLTTEGQQIAYPDYFERRKFEKTHKYETNS